MNPSIIAETQRVNMIEATVIQKQVCYTNTVHFQRIAYHGSTTTSYVIV